MRDYLFRGKRKDNGEWVYGNFYKYGLAFMFACVNFVFRFGKAEKALKERKV